MERKHLYLLISLFSIALTLYSCRKDIEFLIEGKTSPNIDQLEAAKVLYFKEINPNDYRERLKPKWNESWIVSNNQWSTMIVPAPEQKLNTKNTSVRRFFIFRFEGNALRTGNIKEFWGKDYDVNKNIDNLVILDGKEGIPGFTGDIIDYDLNYNFIGSKVYRKGNYERKWEGMILVTKGAIKDIQTLSNLVGNESNKLKAENAKKTSLSKNASSDCSEPPLEYWANAVPPINVPEGSVCTVYYTITRMYDGECLVAIEYNYTGHYCSLCTSCAVSSNGGGDNSGGSSGSSGGNPGYGGGGGGDGGSFDITHELTDYPCAESLLQALPNLNNNIADILNEYFVGSESFNIHFKAALLPVNIAGEYRVVTQFGEDNLIVLNSSMLNTSSKEFILATMYHEVIHAYLFQEKMRLGSVQFAITYPNWNEYSVDGRLKYTTGHANMSNFVNDLADAIQSFNPSLPRPEAVTLAKGGIINNMTSTEINLNTQHKNGTTGTSCN